LIGLALVIQMNFACYAQNSRFEQISFKSALYKEPLRYIIYKPKNYKANNKYALVLFLHGSGEVGDNLSILKTRGLPKLIDEGKEFPFILVAPQLPFSMDKKWSPIFTNEFILQAITSLPIDKDRVYITGISIGGTGVWDYSCQYPDKIAAAIPMSGWGNVHEMCKMASVPTMCFHGSADKTVNPTGSRNLIGALQKCGGRAKLVEFENGGHDIWRESYDHPGMWEWMLSQKKGVQLVDKLPRRIDQSTSAYKLPKALNGITGILIYKDELYAISGTNSQAIIFNFDTLGAIKSFSKLSNAANLSWQDITSSEDGYVYVADVGNENFKRTTFQIYRTRLQDISKETQLAEKFDFNGTSIALNFKAMYSYGKDIYLLGESRTKESMVVKIFFKSEGRCEAILIGKLPKFQIGSISSAYYDCKTSRVWMLGDRKIAISSKLNSGDSIINSEFTYQNLPTNYPKDGLSLTAGGKKIFAEPHFLGNFEGNLYLMR
jgi:poly(3-hydroxybutyrate) depolymerase